MSDSVVRVVIAGGGIAGNALARQLRQDPTLDITIYEQRSITDASPLGLNVLMNHNGMSVLEQTDPELFDKITENGSPVSNWSARMVDGTILYDLKDVVDLKLASTPAFVARWDYIHAATRCDDITEYGTKVLNVQRSAELTDKLRVQVQRSSPSTTTSTEWIEDVDYLVAADGRYSTLREALSPPKSFFGPPCVADFRIVVPDIDLPDQLDPMWRVYHKPHLATVLKGVEMKEKENSALVCAASSYVRVGLMRLGPRTLGVFGNIPILENEKPDPVIQNASVLSSLFQPGPGEPSPDSLGAYVIQMLKDYGDTAHWTRKQETNTCYTALENRVVFIGDSAGAIFPSLGQGANLSLEDAAVTAAAFPDFELVAKLRTPRRNFIQQMSREHARHITEVDYFQTELSNWAEAGSVWREKLRRLWACGPQLALRAQWATTENVKPFGQLITESLDGDIFDPSKTDADLDLSKGIPRLYLMKLTGGRPLRVDRMTRHRAVTQCLGALGLHDKESSFYLCLHEPTETPTLSGLVVLKFPPRQFIKLSVGTWHAGPMWDGSDDSRTFYNLELSNTNQVDHDTVFFANLPPFFIKDGVDHNDQLVVPIRPVV